MNSRQRSLSGILLGIVLLPVLATLVACIDIMPVPVGDPEKSRVDPSLSGLWLDDGDVWVLEPYDKRTWLLSVYSISDEECGDNGDNGDPAGVDPGMEDETATTAPEDEQVVEVPADLEVAEEFTEQEIEEVVEEIVEIEPVEDDYASQIEALRAAEPDCLAGESEGIVVKMWLTRLGGAEFMTWEFKGGFDEDTGFTPQEWFVFRIIREGRDTLRLRLLDADFEGFDAERVQARLDKLEAAGTGDKRALDSARRAVEKVIRRNVDNPDLYFEDDFAVLLRIQPQDFDLFVGEIVPDLR